MKGLSEKDFKAAREAFQPSLKRDKKYDGSDIFTNPKLDESLYSALKRPEILLLLSLISIHRKKFIGNRPIWC